MVNAFKSLKCLVGLISVFLPVLLFAQEPNNGDRENQQFQIEDLVTIPKTPEAAAFTEYANSASVSQYTGKASVNIPLASLQGKKLGESVSLSYQTGGIRVQQEAGTVGLGWNLNAGGMITRNINGLPDDYLSADWRYYPFYSSVDWKATGVSVNEAFNEFIEENYSSYHPYSEGFIELYRHFRNDATKFRTIDTQPDTYSFNAGGLSGTLYIDYSDDLGSNVYRGYCIEHPDVIVEVSLGSPDGHGIRTINSWEIQDNQGTIYTFSQTERTRIKSDGAFRNGSDSREYSSGWYLNRVDNFFLKDEIEFVYSSEITTSEYGIIGGGDSIEEPLTSTSEESQLCGTTQPISSGVINYTYIKRNLTSIIVNEVKRADFFYGTDRKDLPGRSYLSNAIFYGPIDEDSTDMEVVGSPISEVQLDYAYFGTDDSFEDAIDPPDAYTYRLRLETVRLLDNDVEYDFDISLDDYQQYRFEYDDQDLPNRDSYAQDYWGYYNGANSNPGLVPQNTQFDSPTSNTGNRESDANSMQAGVLTRVHYPTGGNTSFEFQPNTVPSEVASVSTEVIGDFQLSGGTYPSGEDPYDYSTCDPQGGLGVPLTIFKAFAIEETDTYKINITRTDGDLTDAVQVVAIRRPAFQLCEAVQPTDPDSFQFLESTPENFPLTEYVSLDPGKYLIMILNNKEGMNLRVSITREVSSGTIINVPVGGLRVLKKQDSDENGMVATTTYFNYSDISDLAGLPSEGYLEAGAGSTGMLHHSPMFERYSTREVINQDKSKDQIYVCEILSRSASNFATATPNIVSYSTVSMTQVNGAGNILGATIIDFFNENESVNDRPFSKTEALNGMIKEKRVYKVNESNELELQLREENVYHKEPLPNGVVAFYFNTNESGYYDMVVRRQSEGSDIAILRYQPTYISDFSGSDRYAVPCTEVNDPGGIDPLVWHCYGLDEPIAIYTQQPFAITDYWLQQVSTKTTQYENDIGLENLVTYEYDETVGTSQFQVSTVTRTYANSTVETLDYFYAADESITSLVDQNRVTEPVRLQRRVGSGATNDPLLSEKLTIYDAAGRPEEIQLAHNEQTLESRAEIISYDLHNNITQLRGPDGIYKTYIWGYDGQYLVAQIINASPAEILGTGVSLGARSKELLDADRAQLANIPNAQVTTYKYKAGIGVSEVQDPNGKRLYYEYDAFNRLYMIKDHKDNVVKQFDYNYINN